MALDDDKRNDDDKPILDNESGEAATAETSASRDVESRVIEVTLVGVSPLLMQTMSQDDIVNTLIRGKQKPPNKDEPLEDKAMRCLYLQDPDADETDIVIPAENLFASLREAGRQVKFDGKRMVSAADKTLLPGFYSALTQHAAFLVDGQPARHSKKTYARKEGRQWSLDIRKGNMPATGGAVGIVRPRFESWSLRYQFMLNLAPPVTQEVMRRLFDIAGNSIGLCGYRPEKNGPFGRFRVADWKVIDEAK